jgi:hypothetical protein
MMVLFYHKYGNISRLWYKRKSTRCVLFLLYVVDLDVRRFCRGENTPLAMMGVAPRRYLPGCNAILVTIPI